MNTHLIKAIKMFYCKKPNTEQMENKKEITITAPEGKEIDMKVLNDTGRVEFIDVAKKLPTCIADLGEISGWWLDEDNDLLGEVNHMLAINRDNQNIYPTKELAHAVQVLPILIQLRDAYNDGWVPDWKNGDQSKYVISTYCNIISLDYVSYRNYILNFKTKKLRDTFCENFKDMLEIAKPLL